MCATKTCATPWQVSSLVSNHTRGPLGKVESSHHGPETCTAGRVGSSEWLLDTQTVAFQVAGASVSMVSFVNWGIGRQGAVP